MKTRLMTYADYAAMPDDGRRYEIYEGELVVVPAPDRRHQNTVGALYALLWTKLKKLGLGNVMIAPFDVLLSQTSVVQPDILFIATDGPGHLENHGLVGAPTLAIEVLSPSTKTRDLGIKKVLYARYGTPWFWIVDHRHQRIAVHRLVDGAFVLDREVCGSGSVAIPPLEAITIDLGEIWNAR